MISISASETALTIAHGGSVPVDVEVARTGGYTGAVLMRADLLPRGHTVTFTPSVLPPGVSRTVMRLSVQGTAIPGTNVIELRGTAAGVGSTGHAIVVMVPAAADR